MALNTTKLGLSGVNALFKQYYGRDATPDELNYWANKSDADLRPRLIPNSAVQLAQNKPGGLTPQEQADKIKYDAAIAAAIHDKNGSTPAEIEDAILRGDFSGIVDFQGKPFSDADQQAALAKADAATKAFYEQQQVKDKADAEAALAQKQANYQDYLINSAQSFQNNKTAADQTAADNGVLFSGGRVQKEKNLAQAYAQDQASTLGTATRDIGAAANDFQYKYGGDAANGLSKYYQLGSNSFNPNVATGGATANGLSTVYNPNNYNFQGTVNNEQKANNATRAAGYLWNKGNKLLTTGYNNKF